MSTFCLLIFVQVILDQVRSFHRGDISTMVWDRQLWTTGIHAPLVPRTARCDLVRYYSVFIGAGAVRFEFFKHFAVLVRSEFWKILLVLVR